MATKRSKSNLAPGTSILDYASPARIQAAFGSEREIRAEYSRQRSIIRKRIERMETAGEVKNWVYDIFGDLKSAMPTAKGLTTNEMMRIMSTSARVLSGGYKSTMREIRESRKSVIDEIRNQADEAGDVELAELLRTNPSSKQWSKITTTMGMIQRIVGKMYDSDTVMAEITREVMRPGASKRSLLSVAATVINSMGIGDDDSIEKLSERFTASGSTRISWSKTHKERK